jgi:SAM-dependent methyltransferase
MDNRQGFSWLYDAHHSTHTEDIPFWLSIAQRHASQPVLELGCGSGRVAVALAQAGCSVVGLDIDPEMLFVLQKRLDDLPEICLPFVQADMTDFHLELTFSAILLPCNTLSTFSAAERQKIFDLTASHLQPEGWFAASIPNPDYLRLLPTTSPPEIEDVFKHPLDQEPVQVSSSWKRDREFFTVTWNYDHLLPDGRVERTNVRVRHSLEPLSIYQEQLKAAVLTLKETYGDFDGSVYTLDSPNLILVAQRPYKTR